MAGENAGAMFYFDTNIDRVASDITAALARINASLAEPLRLNAAGLTSNQNLMQGFGRDIEGQMDRRIKDLRGKMAGLNPAQMRAEFERSVGTFFNDVPNMLARGLGRMPGTAANSAPVKQYAQELARGYYGAVRTALSESDPAVAAALKNVPFPVAKYNALGKAPVNFADQSDPEAYYRNRLRAEGILRRDPAYGAASRAKAESMGFTPEYMNALHQETVTPGPKGALGFTATDAGARLKELSEFGAVRVREENRVREALDGQVRAMQRQLALAERQVAVAQRGALADSRASARAEGRQGGVLTGFFNKLSGNQGQTILNNVGSHIASAAQFTAGYGALFAVQHAVKDTVHEYLEYQQALTDLQVATRNTGAVTDDWVNSLSDVSRITGENVAQSMEAAARGVRAFASPLNTTKSDLQAIGSAANDAANKLALVADKPLKDATGDLLAVGTSYGFQPDQLDRVVDAVANAKRLLGGDPGQISQGLASIATSASTSGFDVNQAADLVSLVQSRTDESGQAAATRLTRIFQTISGTTGKGLGDELGVNTNQSVMQQLLGKGGYAEMYNAPGTSRAVKDRITSQLGGTANLRELLAVLENAKDLQDAFGESASHAGAGTAEFNRKADSLRGTLTKIKGDITHIQTNLGRTDIGAPFAIAVRSIEPMLHLLNRLLETIDKMPSGLKIVAGLMADVAIASKAIAVVSNVRAASAARRSIINGDGGRAAEAEAIAAAAEARSVAEANLIRAIEAATLARGGAEGAEDLANGAGGALGGAGRTAEKEALSTAEKGALGTAEVAAGASAGRMGMMGGLTRLGGFIANPWVLGGAAVLGAGYLTENYLDARSQRANNAGIQAGTSASYERITGSRTSINSAIADLQNAAGRIENADSNMFSGGDQEHRYNQLRGQIRQLRTLGKGVTAEQSGITSGQSVFGAGGVITSVSELQSGMEKLARSGDTARRQLALVEDALNNVATPAHGQQYQPATLGAQAAGAAVSSLKDAIGGRHVDLQGAPILPPGGRTGQTGNNARGKDIRYLINNEDAKDAYTELSSAQNVNRISRAFQREGSKLGLKQGDTFTDEQREKLAHAAADALNLKDIVDPKERARFRNRAYAIILSSLKVGADGGVPSGQLNGNGDLSRGQILALLNDSPDGKHQGLITQMSAAESSTPTSDGGTMLERVQRRNLATLRGMRKRFRGSKNIGILEDAIDTEEGNLAQSAISRLEQLREHDQNAKGLSRSQIRSIGRKALAKEVAAAGDQVDQLIGIMDRADKTSLDIVEKHLKAAADLAAHDRVSILNNPQYYKPHVGIDGEQAGPINPVIPKAGETDAEKKYKAFQKGRRRSHPTNDPWGGDFAGGSTKDPKDDGTVKEEMTKEQLRALKARSEVNPTDTVAAARADIAVSLANVHAAQKKYANKKGTLEDVYAAEQDLAEKRQAYTQSEVDLAGAIAGAKAARTGGAIAGARAQIQGAAAAMRANAKHTIGWWQGLQSFYEGQEAMRQAVMEYKNNRDKLHGDITDPVENARDQLRADQRALRAARNKEDRTAARAAIRQDKAGLQDSKFQQRMSDMQTGEELGRISFAKYMSYLDHEHDRLSKIHHRTRQQQDELDTVDKAMKDALSSMDSQFNLGDINTNGLVYQVRRFKAEMAGGGVTPHMTAAQAATNQTVTISINGADTAMVKRTIDSYLRIGGGQRQTLTRRKV